MRNYSSDATMALAVLVAGGLYWYSRTQYGVKEIRYDVTPEPYTPPEPSPVEKAVEWVSNIFSARGLRNNNPGNIVRTATQWAGMAPDQSGDSRFIVFASPVYGIRAMARVLRNYQQRGLLSVKQIISTWAPPNENNTLAYINTVAASIGIAPTAPVPAALMPALIAAIIKHENGQQPYTPEVIAEGIRLERES